MLGELCVVFSSEEPAQITLGLIVGGIFVGNKLDLQWGGRKPSKKKAQYELFYRFHNMDCFYLACAHRENANYNARPAK